MSVDEQLTLELATSANSQPASLSEWQPIRAAAFGRRRRRRRRVAAFSSCLVVLAVVSFAVVMLKTADDTQTSVVVRPSESQIVAYVNSGVAVLSPDGQPLRTLYTSGQLHTFGGFSVTADGRVMYATADPVAPGGLCPKGSATPGVPDVVRVSTIDGRAERLAQGWWPIVTPDGRWLAYDPASCDSVGPLQLRIMNIKTGATRGMPHAAGRSIGRLTPLAWSPGGSRLLVGVHRGNPTTDRQGGVRLLIVDPSHWNAAPVKVNVSGRIKNATYLPDGRVLVQYLDAKRMHQFVAIDPQSGTEEHRFQSSVPDSGAIGPFSFSLSADAFGRVLVTYEQGTLQTWAPGDSEPTTLESNAPFAAWLPFTQAPHNK